MNVLRFCAKTALFLLTTLVLSPLYIFILFLFYPWRLSIGPGLVRFYSGICLAIYRVKIRQGKGSRSLKKLKGSLLIISNHASFLDIFVLSARFGTAFVSKAEVRTYPVIGQIARLMGSIFFDRASSKERMRVLNSVARGHSGRVLAVFPQGTTGGISERLSFHRGIFKVIELNPKLTIVPVTLYYRDDAGIAWVRPQSLRENAARVCGQKKIPVKLIVHQPVTIEDYRGKTAAEVCRMVENTVLGPLAKPYREL
ncbi:MAG: lysophospholipid acyltransferase family protein [Nitrospiraceae bacterium]|nr:lysophospholipid acyltransferase family protein [Nitrospiraceae bacterium]